MTQKELNTIIERHQHWLNRDCDGWKGMRANLTGVDLSDATLSGADLRNACLVETNLKKADLDGTDLSGADLRRANLTESNLFEAILSRADLRRTNLTGAYLEETTLIGANLSKANLSNANLFGSDLSYANLDDADLRGANLKKVILSYANLNKTKLDDSEKCRLGMVLKESMNGYKKTAEGNVIELEIPKGAIVFSINNGKCRTNKVIVKKCKGIQHSICDRLFTYKEGDEIEITDFNEKYNVECGGGIHFFRTKTEAEQYK